MSKLFIAHNGLFRFVIVIVVMLLLILGVMKSYLDNKPTVDQIDFAMAQHNFIKTLSLIRGQWLIEGRHSEVEFVFFDQQGDAEQSSVFMMSALGWPSIRHQSTDYCQALWAQILNLKLSEMNKSIFITTNYQKNDDIVCQICEGEQKESCIVYSTIIGIIDGQPRERLNDK